MGKAYANRKPIEDNDFFETPKCLTQELLKNYPIKGSILEPCCGKFGISNILENNGLKVISKDLIYGNNFITDDYTNEHYDFVITNPPFKFWNEIVEKAKKVADKVCVIGRTNYFGSHQRNTSGIWKNLIYIYIFDRQVSYEKKYTDDLVNCGCLVTAWFIYDKNYDGLPMIKIIDVDKYVRRKKLKKC